MESRQEARLHGQLKLRAFQVRMPVKNLSSLEWLARRAIRGYIYWLWPGGMFEKNPNPTANTTKGTEQKTTSLVFYMHTILYGQGQLTASKRRGLENYTENRYIGSLVCSYKCNEFTTIAVTIGTRDNQVST